jgi:hypothetical protein
MPRRFPPPWSIDERTESFIVKDATGQQLAYVMVLIGSTYPRNPTVGSGLPKPPSG